MSDIEVPNARIVGLWLQLFATGAYLVYFVQCIDILRRRVRESMHMVWLPLACAIMFIITIMTDVLDMILAYDAFSVGPGKYQDPGRVYYNSGSMVSVFKNAATVVLAIVSDFIIVYRTFVVWNCSVAVILVPVVLLLGDLALGIWSSWSLAQTHHEDNPIAAAVSVRVRYFFVVTFGLNMLCAGLICWKIWSVHSSVPAHVSSVGHSPISRVFEVIVETAGIYCTHLFILIVSDSVRSNLFFLFLDPLPPVTALVFTMLIVRARSPSELHGTTTPSALSSFWRAESESPSVHSSGYPGGAFVGDAAEVDFKINTRSQVDLESSGGRPHRKSEEVLDSQDLERRVCL